MADAKITQLTALGSPSLTDLLAVVDMSGTPTTKKVELGDALALASGGNITSTSAHASPPASPSAGDLWLPNNSFYAYRYSGSVWVPWGPIFPMTPPDDSQFIWGNQGTASVLITNGGIYLSDVAAAGNNVRMRMKNAPATPYTITAAFLAAPGVTNYVGLGFRQSSDGKLATLEFYYDGTTRIGTSLWTNATTYSSQTSSKQVAVSSLIWFRIQDDGVNRISSYSYDGQNFEVIFTVSRTGSLTADQVFFWVNPNSAGTGPRMTLLSWKET